MSAAETIHILAGERVRLKGERYPKVFIHKGGEIAGCQDGCEIGELEMEENSIAWIPGVFVQSLIARGPMKCSHTADYIALGEW